jgi:hypothetical protein
MLCHGIEGEQQLPHARDAHAPDCPETAEAATIMIQRPDDDKGRDRCDRTKRDLSQYDRSAVKRGGLANSSTKTLFFRPHEFGRALVCVAHSTGPAPRRASMSWHSRLFSGIPRRDERASGAVYVDQDRREHPSQCGQILSADFRLRTLKTACK